MDKISEYSGNNSYSCGLDLTRESVQELFRQIEEAFFSCQTKEERSAIPMLVREEPRTAAGYMPDVLISLGLVLASGAVSTAFVKLINAWISERNGRKLRVRLPNGFEVEATQLGQKKFEQLFATLYEAYGTKVEVSPVEKFLAELKARGFEVVADSNQESVELQTALVRKRDEIADSREAEENPNKSDGHENGVKSMFDP